MSWWNLPDSKVEWTGDTPADLVVDLLAPLKQMAPKPTVDNVLDALEVVFADDTLVSDAPLGERTLAIRDRPRCRGPAQSSLVEVLRNGLPPLVAAYREEFHRAPTLRELIYSISFAFVADVAEYSSDETGELYYIKITG